MASTNRPTAPLGVKALAVWAAITGLALLLLGGTGAPWYLPLGAGALAAAYGLWALRFWGLVLAGVVLAVEGVTDAMEGAAVELLVVVLLLGYLYRQRRHFPSVPA